MKPTIKKTAFFNFVLLVFLSSLHLTATLQADRQQNANDKWPANRGLYGDDLVNSKYASYLAKNHQVKDIIRKLESNLDDSYFIDIHHKHGVKVVTQLNTIMTTFCGNTNGIWSVKKQDYPEIKKYVLRALDKYPPGFVRQYMTRIVVASKLTMKDVDVGGYTWTSGVNKIFISTRENRYEALTGLIHHEFNHLLSGYRRNFKQDGPWITFNPKGFHYGSGGCAAVMEGKSDGRHLDKYLKKGFASEYGTASIEEDMATLAGYAISDWDGFQDKALRYDPIKNKFSLIMQFYSLFDSRLDDRFWMQNNGEKLNQDVHRPASLIFFLDDPKIASNQHLQYRLFSLIDQKPSWHYQSEIKKKNRPIRKTNGIPTIINDTPLFYKVKLLPPETNIAKQAILVAPGQKQRFPSYNQPSISNFWALEVHSIKLQPTKEAIKPAEDLPQGIFLVKDVMDINKRLKKSRVPMREIYLSTLFEKKVGENFPTRNISEKDYALANKNPFGYVVINDTQHIVTVQTYSQYPKVTKIRRFRIVPSQSDASGLHYPFDGIEIVK